jgi:hypothetical protein
LLRIDANGNLAATSGVDPVPSVVVIEVGRTERQRWLDLWCFQLLAWRDRAARYKQTDIRVLWSLIRRLLTNSLFENETLIRKVYAPGITRWIGLQWLS